MQQPKPQLLPGAPPSMNQEDALGDRTRDEEAKRVAEFHSNGQSRKRYRDLTAQKYLIHYDGEGDAQWADLYDGNRISIPRNIAGYTRTQENLLRPIVDNMVAYHTTQPFRFVADTRNDREARERAYLDQAVVNYLSTVQRWNAVAAEAMLFACAYGHCPIHAFVRDDVRFDEYEPLYMPREQAEQQGLYFPRRIIIDAMCGDPWDTVYDSGAKRYSVHGMTYGRVVPADLARETFQRPDLEGNTRMPSASRFQRIARQWNFTEQNVHGSAVMHHGRGGDELIALVCREIAAGVDPRFPEGRLTIVALNGSSSTDMSEGQTTKGTPTLVHDGPLPAGRFSSVRIYSGTRADDVLGKPFIADMDDLQVMLNQLISRRTEYIRRSTHPPLLRSGILEMDGAIWDDDVMLQGEPGMTGDTRFLEMPSRQIGVLNEAIADCRNAMYQLGGYNAASRGESHAGDPAAKVVALARADDTLHGPTNMRFREAMEDFAQLNWALFKEYADVPITIDAAGKDFADLDDPFIDRSRISESPPTFRLTSTAGATPESRMDQLLGMVQMKGADGEPLLTTEEFKASFPDRSVFPEEKDVTDITEQRASFLARKMRDMVGTIAEDPQASSIPMEMLAQMALQAFMQEYPPQKSDNEKAHIEEMIALAQDEHEQKLVRAVAELRLEYYQMRLQQKQMQAQMAQMQAQAGGQPPQGQGRPSGGPSRPNPRAADAARGADGAPSQMARSITPTESEISRLTQAAERGRV